MSLHFFRVTTRRAAQGALVLCLAAWGLAAHAHSLWLIPEGGAYLIGYGHDLKNSAYAPGKVTRLAAYDAAGASLALTRTDSADAVRFTPPAKAALIVIDFDNGIWSRKEGDKSLNLPMNKNPGATSGVHALKFHKTVLAWGAQATRAVGQRYEVLPLDAAAPAAGQAMRVRVLLDGKPVAGAKVGNGEDADAQTTDADGVARYLPKAGHNLLWSGLRQKVSGDAQLTDLSFEYALGFDAR